jgi:hypothetical protein
MKPPETSNWTIDNSLALIAIGLSVIGIVYTYLIKRNQRKENLKAKSNELAVEIKTYMLKVKKYIDEGTKFDKRTTGLIIEKDSNLSNAIELLKTSYSYYDKIYKNLENIHHTITNGTIKDMDGFIESERILRELNLEIDFNYNEINITRHLLDNEINKY